MYRQLSLKLIYVPTEFLPRVTHLRTLTYIPQMLARGLKGLNEESTLKYRPLALHLSTEYFIEHSSKDVRLLVACCISDLFRIYSPDGPYTDTELLHVCSR